MKWIGLGEAERKLILQNAALAADIDITDPAYQSALQSAYANAKHGVNQSHIGRPKKSSLVVFRRLSESKATRLAAGAGASKLRNAGKVMAVIGAAVTVYSIYDALGIDNPYLQDMAIINIKMRNGGDVTMLDEVSILDDLYHLTNNGVAAAWGWRYWANQNGMEW